MLPPGNLKAAYFSSSCPSAKILSQDPAALIFPLLPVLSPALISCCPPQIPANTLSAAALPLLHPKWQSARAPPNLLKKTHLQLQSAPAAHGGSLSFKDFLAPPTPPQLPPRAPLPPGSPRLKQSLSKILKRQHYLPMQAGLRRIFLK